VRYVPSKIAARAVGLVPDYVSRMCREGLVRAIRHAGVWHVEEVSLGDFLKNQASEYEEFKKRKSEYGKEMLNRSNLPVRSRIVTRPHPVLTQHHARIKRRAKMVQTSGIALATLVLVASSAFGFEILAPVGSANRAELTNAIDGAGTHMAAAASLPFIDSFASKVFATLCPYINSCPKKKPIIVTETLAPQKTVVQPSVPIVPAPSVTKTTITNPTTPLENQKSLTGQVERIIQTERVISVSGVTEAYVEQRLASLRADLEFDLTAMENANATSFLSVGG